MVLDMKFFFRIDVVKVFFLVLKTTWCWMFFCFETLVFSVHTIAKGRNHKKAIRFFQVIWIVKLLRLRTCPHWGYSCVTVCFMFLGICLRRAGKRLLISIAKRIEKRQLQERKRNQAWNSWPCGASMDAKWHDGLGIYTSTSRLIEFLDQFWTATNHQDLWWECHCWDARDLTTWEDPTTWC